MFVLNRRRYYIPNKDMTVDEQLVAFRGRCLLTKNTTLVGTLKKNKADIQKEMQLNSVKPEHSSVFGFDGEKTLASYVPKKGKAVIMMSTLHHDRVCSSSESKTRDNPLLQQNQRRGGQYGPPCVHLLMPEKKLALASHSFL